MRALFTVLAFLLPLLVGCDKLAPSGPPGSASAAARDDEAKFDKLMAEGARANLAGRPAGAEARIRDALSVRRQQCERAHLGTDCPEILRL